MSASGFPVGSPAEPTSHPWTVERVQVGDELPPYTRRCSRLAVEITPTSSESVTSAEPVHEVTFETSTPPQIGWDHLTDPTKRPQGQRLVDEVLSMTEGRRGIGTVNHGMHGHDVIIEYVADWRPFSSITLRYDVAGIENWAWTHQLDPVGGGTHLTMRLSDPGAETWAQIGPESSASVDDQTAALEQMLTRLSAAAQDH